MLEINAPEFVRRLKLSMEESESRFSFFLGSGCSVSSGIPTVASLVRTWLPQLKRLRTGSEHGVDKWAPTEFPGYTDATAGRHYGAVIERLFPFPELRQKEIERLCDERDPAFGYAVLAQLMGHAEFGRHCNVVLSTNFDDMVADALYLYTNKKPLVIAHESLVGFVRVSRTRPLVVKLHGDARLTPRNTVSETSALDSEVHAGLRTMLLETGLIFLGYSGSDESIAHLLADLPPAALPWGVYWVNDRLPEGPLADWLKQRGAVWVRHLDFDELMLLIWHEFDLDHPDSKRFEDLMETYSDTFKTLNEKLRGKPDTAEKRALEQAAEKAVSEAEDWWGVGLEAATYEETDPARAERIYQDGLTRFPDSAELVIDYALFRSQRLNDVEGARVLLQRAIELDPDSIVSAKNLGRSAREIHTAALSDG